MLEYSHDLHVAGRGPSFDETRYLNTLSGTTTGPMGNWQDTMQPHLTLHTIEGNDEPGDPLAYEDGTGAVYPFYASGKGFQTPPFLKATLCGVESHTESNSPCEALPVGVSYRLTYNQSQMHVDFNSYGRAIGFRDRYGNALTTNDGQFDASKVTDTEGRTFSYVKTEAGENRSPYAEISDVAGARAVHYTYVNGMLAKYADANGGVTTYKEGSSITTPAGRVTKIVDTNAGTKVEIIETDNAEHTTGPTWRLELYEPGKAPVPCSATQHGTVVTDPDGVDGQSGHKTTYCSNAFAEVEQIADADGNVGQSSFDGYGNATASTAAAPGNGEVGAVESFKYDSFGQNLECAVVSTTTVEGSCPAKGSSSALITNYSYKDKNNPFSATQVQDPQFKSTFACYNGGLQEGSEGPACPASEKGAPAGSLQNENDQLSEQHEAKFSYNANGTIKSSTDPDGHTTSYKYDETGNLNKVTPPSGSGISATSITVDADSRPHVITDGAGHIETITYDKLDRVTEIAYTGTGTAKAVKYEYDADGNLLKREDPTGTTKYTVDQLNRVTKEELPGSLSNSYEYDDASNLTAFTDGGGKTTYKYNNLSELESMLEPGEAKETKFAYDNDHRLTKITYPSGASENYKLEPTTGRPETVTAEGITGTTVPKLTYTYKEGEDNTSLVQSLTESTGNTTSYLYDKLNRLSEANTKGPSPSHYLYKLDGAGNRTSQEVSTTAETGGSTTYYVLNAGNELKCRQTVTGACSNNSSTELSAYTYDGAGEETAIKPKADTSGTTFAYNAASETSSLTPSGSGTLAFSYGGTGQDDLTALGSTTTLQQGQLGLTREVSSAGTSYYARTPNGLLIDQRTPSGHYNPLYDGQGDIIGLVSSTGKVERTFRYGPYGENTHSEGTQTIPYPFGYKGGYRTPGGNKGEGNVANGLYHYGQRYYDPTTGRWTQQDPLSHLGSTAQGDRFLFAGSDPINEADPSGLCFIFSCSDYHEAERYVSRAWESKYGEADPLKVVEWGYEYSDLKECFAEEGDCEQAAHDIAEYG